jgi:hypothetical protein
LVTKRENQLRGARGILQTHCKHGHMLAATNLKWRSNRLGNPGRVCRTCEARWESKRQRRKA